MLHDLFDARTKQYCVLLEDKTWIVWAFEYDPPVFEDDKFQLSELFPTFASIYRVHATKQGQQSFLKCDCRHYERCGIPCCHILAITDEIEETMITVQHRKVFQVHYGCPDSDISKQLMKAVSMQTIRRYGVSNIRRLPPKIDVTGLLPIKSLHTSRQFRVSAFLCRYYSQRV